MGRYYIDYNTGVEYEEVVGTLMEAKIIAEEGLRYTQQPVAIYEMVGDVDDSNCFYDDPRHTVAYLPWFGVAPSEDDVVTAAYEDWGFYGAWEERNA